MSHNDLLELALDHLHDASLEPQFFLSLSQAVSAACTGIEKDMGECEEGCARYHRQWETLASLLSMHDGGSCICGRNGGSIQCPAAKYLTGIWDISAFFHLRDGEGA